MKTIKHTIPPDYQMHECPFCKTLFKEEDYKERGKERECPRCFKEVDLGE